MNSDNEKVKLAAWRRPEGPLNVWRVIEGEERVGDTARPVRFSVQDVPEDRFDEAVEHMCQYFTAEEATCKALKLIEDKDAIDDFRGLWYYLLKIGLSVGAYKLGEDDSLQELVAVNILFLATDEIDAALENFTKNFKSNNARKIFEFMYQVSQNADACDIYGINTYISALGLSVAPTFRGQKLGVRLLEARDDIGRKYGITATSTLFTAPASQIQAERAEFETAYTQCYEDFKDEDGQPLFPNIQAKVIKIMMKRLQ